MAKTSVSLALPYTFCDEGNYLVSLDGRVASITIEYVQATDTLDKIIGMTTMGKMMIRPDDPEGLANFSKITIQFPFLTQHAFTDDAGFENTPNLYEEATNESARYLNRLREVIRYLTRRYWIRDISKTHIRIYSIRPEKDDGMGRTRTLFIPPMNYNFPISIREQEEMNPQIQEMLMNDKIIPLPERLYSDSLNFFSNGRYQEAIVNANTAMEVAFVEQVRKINETNGKTYEESGKILGNISQPRKFEHKFKRAFFGHANKEEFNKIEIVRELKDIRTKRGNVVHPGVHFFNEEETKNQLLIIHKIISWIMQQDTLSYIKK
jgi:hypothetical protein